MTKKEASINGAEKATNKSNDSEKKKCFFVTPIGKSGSPESKKMKALVSNVLDPVCEENGYKVIVSSTIDQVGSIPSQIITELVESELVIVDLTNLNPNVMYELGVRHSFNRPCIVICQNDTSLPFDVAAERTIFFDDSIEGSGNLKTELQKKIDATVGGEMDSPIARAINRNAVVEMASNNKDDKMSVLIDIVSELQTEVQDLSYKRKYDNVDSINSMPNVGDEVMLEFPFGNGGFLLRGVITDERGVRVSKRMLVKRIKKIMMEIKDNPRWLNTEGAKMTAIQSIIEEDIGVRLNRRSIYELAASFNMDITNELN